MVRPRLQAGYSYLQRYMPKSGWSRLEILQGIYDGGWVKDYAQECFTDLRKEGFLVRTGERNQHGQLTYKLSYKANKIQQA